MNEFHKFPATPHLLSLTKLPVREDKILTRPEAEEFLRYSVIVEEKVDGANIGISFDSQGSLLLQNRGNLVEHGTKGQFAPFWNWSRERKTQLLETLEDRLILFGEWCYARHTIHYDQLPDYFLAFDLFDKKEKRYVSTTCRNQIVRDLKLASVPEVSEGIFNFEELQRLIGTSSLYNGPMEGIYLRRENSAGLIARAKIVCPKFIQHIGEHWSRHPLVPNRLVTPLLLSL